MPSQALEFWETDRHAEIWLARTLAVQPQTGPTAQAVANILLASYGRVTVAEFQAFCAALYEEAIGRELKASVSAEMHDLVVNQLKSQTALDRGNPTHENLRRDSDRLGADLRKARLVQRGPVLAEDLTALDDQLMKVRNGLAHGDARYPSVESGQAAGEIVTVALVDEWLVALDRIANTVDTVVGVDLGRPLGGRPW